LNITARHGRDAANVPPNIFACGVGAYAYDLGMSVADFLYAAAVTGMSEPLTLAVMGTRAAADSVAASRRMGRSDERSIITGTLAGLVEAGTEHIGFDALFGTNVRSLGKAGFRSYLLRNAGAEGSEEGLSDAVNWAIDDLYDLVTGTRESEFQHMVSEYERQGSAHPTLAAIGQRAKELGLDMLGGALSGLFLSGANAALNLGLDTQTDSTPADVWEFLEPEKKRELDVEAALFPELQEKLDGAAKTQADTKTAAPDGTAEADAILRTLTESEAEAADFSPGGNRRLTEADAERWMKTGKTEHQRHQKTRSLESGIDPVLTTEQDIKNYIATAIHGNASPDTRVFRVIGQNMADAVQLASEGQENVKDWFLELPTNDLMHSYKNHVKAKQQGDIDLTFDDYLHIPEYIDTFDSISYQKYGNGDAEVILGKKIDGYAVIIELVAGKRNALLFKQMRGMSTEKYEGVYKKRTSVHPGDVQAYSANATTSKPDKKSS
jgi:hypothetical protein